MLMARLIYNLNTRFLREGASFAQQYLLNKGLKIFGQKGRDASKKEMAGPNTPKELLHSKIKDTISTVTYCTRITRVLLYWKRMARKALGRGPER
jgi:hypothetical protein